MMFLSIQDKTITCECPRVQGLADDHWLQLVAIHRSSYEHCDSVLDGLSGHEFLTGKLVCPLGHRLIGQACFINVEQYFYPSKIPVNYTIYFKKYFLSEVKNRFKQDNYSKTYNQISFILYVILLKIFIYFTLVSAGHKRSVNITGVCMHSNSAVELVFGWDRKHIIPSVFILGCIYALSSI